MPMFLRSDLMEKIPGALFVAGNSHRPLTEEEKSALDELREGTSFLIGIGDLDGIIQAMEYFRVEVTRAKARGYR